MSISKTCTKNESCEAQINATRDDDMPCDKTFYTWVCTSCCYDDGCNVSSGPRLLPVIPEYILLCSLLVLCFSGNSSGSLDKQENTTKTVPGLATRNALAEMRETNTKELELWHKYHHNSCTFVADDTNSKPP